MTISEKPSALYQKIKNHIIGKIDGGVLKPDDRVPSETELAREFNASRMTANRALKELSEENRIIRVQGVGTFVARPKPDAALLEIKSISQEIADWGGVHSSQVILLKEEAVEPDIARKMNLESGETVYHSIIVHYDRNNPVQYSERFVNPAVAPGYLEQDFTRITPSEYLLEIAPVQEAEHIIEAVLSGRTIQKYLKIRHEEPCLSLKRRTWSFGKIAAYSILISPGSRYKLAGKFKRI